MLDLVVKQWAGSVGSSRLDQCPSLRTTATRSIRATFTGLAVSAARTDPKTCDTVTRDAVARLIALSLLNNTVLLELTRSSAIAEGPRDASCQLKSCQLPRNSAETTRTTSPEPSISCRQLTRATKSCCRQRLTICAINYSGRASELGDIVNLVDRRRPISLSRSERLPFLS